MRIIFLILENTFWKIYFELIFCETTRIKIDILLVLKNWRNWSILKKDREINTELFLNETISQKNIHFLLLKQIALINNKNITYWKYSMIQ